jgi:hypothetical protein
MMVPADVVMRGKPIGWRGSTTAALLASLEEFTMHFIPRLSRDTDSTTEPMTDETRPRRRLRRLAPVTCALLAAGTIAGVVSSATPAFPPGYAAQYNWLPAWAAIDPLSGAQTLKVMQSGTVITDPTRQANTNGAELIAAPNTAYDANQQWYFTPTSRAITADMTILGSITFHGSIPAVQIRQTENGQTRCLEAATYVDGYHIVQNPCSGGNAAHQQWYPIPVSNGWGWYLMSGLSLNDRGSGAPMGGGISSSEWTVSYTPDMNATPNLSATPNTDVRLCGPDGSCKKPLMLTGIVGTGGAPTMLQLRDFSTSYLGWQRFGIDRRNFAMTQRETLNPWSDMLTYAYACPDGFRVAADAGHPERVQYQAQFESTGNMYVDSAKFGLYGTGVNFQKLLENYGSQWGNGNTWQTSNPNDTNTVTIKYRNFNVTKKWAQVTYFCNAQ